jgi:hypothetical protein
LRRFYFSFKLESATANATEAVTSGRYPTRFGRIAVSEDMIRHRGLRACAFPKVVMTELSFNSLAAYWSIPEVETNILVFMNLIGTMMLGLIVGYERSYHGRAAGMRTHSLVYIASAALVVIVGYPGHWYGGHSNLVSAADPTRVIQEIVTGVGLLGAGVIVKQGFNISGLTTTASIWAA